MAAEPGTYVLLSAKNINYALDVKSGIEKNTNGIQLYTRNDTDAQLLRLIPHGDYWQLQFILNGKCVDRYLNSTANGGLIDIFQTNESEAQDWRLIEDGKTVTISGTAYPSYVLKHPTEEVCLDINGGTIANGTKLQVYECNSTDAQRWILFPQNAIPDGTYEIATVMSSTLVLDVSDASTASGANVMIYSHNDGNNQKWKVETDAKGISTIKAVNTGHALDVAGAAAKDGTNVQVYTPNGTQAQQWVIEPSSTAGERNTQPTALYRIHTVSGSGRVLDVCGGKSALGTNVQIYTANSTKAQLFEFIPTEAIATDLPVPASLGWVKTPTGSWGSGSATFAYGDVALYPAWKCNGTGYQLRYRYRQRGASSADSYRSDWSAWCSIADSSTTNSGWGDIQTTNCDTTYTGGYRRAVNPVSGTLSEKGTDLIEWQYEVRRYEEEWGKVSSCAHGNSATGTIRAAVQPTISNVSAVMTPEGMAIGFTSSFKRNNNTVKATGELFDAVTETGLAYTGDYIVVPYNQLKTVPDENAKYSFTLQLTTTDGAASSTTVSIPVSYNASHGTTLTASVSVADTLATVKADTGSTVYLIIERGHGNRLVEYEMENGAVTIAPPIGVDWRMFVMKGSLSGAWASKLIKNEAIEPDGYHLTAIDSSFDFAALTFDSDSGFEVKYERDYKLSITTGREREIAGIGSTVSASWPLECTLVDGYQGRDISDMYDEFDKAAHMGYAIYRDPRGFWAQVLIKSAECDRSKPNSYSVKFSLAEVEV